ncbi:MAG: aspartyl protease family protein [Candidatus Eremiobacteraeota bacterium]|nr:aspartyl protease family protein [Candidatus Eremiobacteraeota bacterium]
MTSRLWRLLPAFFLLFTPVAPAFGAGEPAKVKVKAPDPRAWPVAYEATPTTLADVLAGAKRADGTLAQNKGTMRATYALHDGGLEGTERDVWSDDDYRIDTTIGPFITAEGRFKGQRWETNENGYTLLKRGIHQRAEANVRALEKTDPGDDVKLLGRLHAPAEVYVVRVAPADGREERRFYEASSLRLLRRETAYLDRLVVATYDDYHETKGGAVPYRTTVSDGHAENDAVWTVTDFKVGTQVTEADVSIPGSRRLPVELPAGVASVRLPARIDEWGRVTVRLTVQGRGLDFQLDSGAAGIVINRDVAKELNLKTYGRWSSTVAGTFTSTRAMVPKLNIGTVVMNDVVVEALPFAFQSDNSTRIVGLLGYDFIAGCVVKIDYEHGTVDAIPTDMFQPPAKGYTLDAIMDDQVPLISSKFNDAVGERFILDTGADDVVVFSGFAKKHPAAVEDHSPKQILSRLFNLVQANGVGGKLNLRPVIVANMQVGNVHYPDSLTFVMTGDQPAFEGEDLDGLIGASALRMFDVYLDYANSRVVLVPNGRTRPRKPDDK